MEFTQPRITLYINYNVFVKEKKQRILDIVAFLSLVIIHVLNKLVK
ncbi:MAG: hypothetical protein ACJA1H_000855 [Glaciecola sp.]|jgi:hypothetical protein